MVGINVRKTVCVFQPTAARSEVEKVGKRTSKGDTGRAGVRRLETVVLREPWCRLSSEVELEKA
jgi:hypothetical protein